MDDTEAKETMLRRLIEADQWRRAFELSGELLAVDPDYAYYHQIHGLSALELERHRLAKRHLEAAIGCDPADPYSHFLLGRMYTKEGRPLYAKREYLKAIELDPEDASHWVAYGFNCVSRGDYRSARESAARARELDPNNAAVKSLIASCENRRDDGTTADAYAEIESLRTALEHDPEAAYIYFQIGLIYLEELGDAANAEESFRTALSLDPTDPDYRKYLLKALRRHDPVLRVLHAPAHLFEKGRRFVESAYHERRGTFFALALIAPLAIAVVMIGGMLWGLFLLLPAVFYEYLVMREHHEKAGHIPLNPKGFAGVHSLPFYLRFGAFVVFFLLFVAGIYWLFTAPEMKAHLGNIVSGLFLVGLIVGFIISARRPHQE